MFTISPSAALCRHTVYLPSQDSPWHGMEIKSSTRVSIPYMIRQSEPCEKIIRRAGDMQFRCFSFFITGRYRLFRLSGHLVTEWRSAKTALCREYLPCFMSFHYSGIGKTITSNKNWLKCVQCSVFLQLSFDFIGFRWKRRFKKTNQLKKCIWLLSCVCFSGVISRQRYVCALLDKAG